ncbi:MAG: HAD family phosphatase [Treponema sp.]|jgi:putative hydrolase of the HAD superfamily|nr:HAD family phosphatase [Treponema sp.]
MGDEWGTGGRIKVAVFDYGKVISFPPEDKARAEIAALGGIALSALDELDRRYRGEHDRGVLSGVDFYKTILIEAGRNGDDAAAGRMLEADLQSWSRVNPAAVKLMEDLKAAGLKLGILSNMPREFLTIARKQFPVFQLPDAGIFSCEIGSIKPEDGIYEALFATLGCSPYEIVFVDDLRPNVEAARVLGMNAFVWKDADAARELFAKLEIPL